MGEFNDDRRTRIERLLEELNIQTSELQRLAGELAAGPKKPVKRRVTKLAVKRRVRNGR